MERLSALDALFLYLETPETPMHVGSVTTFAPPPPGVDAFAAFRAHIAARLDALPSFRRKLVPTPFGLDHPNWVIDDDIDLDWHIRHLALPRPGTMSQLRELVAHLHAQPLSRERPLWEYHVIDGFEGDGFAIYAKAHHSAMDGLAGMATLPVVFGFHREGDPAPPTALVRPQPEKTGAWELTGSALADLLRHGVRAVRALPALALGVAKAAPALSQDVRYLLRYAKGTPRTPLNAPISGERVYATCTLPLHEAKELAKARGATINDVVMALCAGALRRYLLERDALPETALVAGVPVSIRPPGDAQINNQVVFSLSRLPTHLVRPLPRLAAARKAGQEAKTLFADVRDLLTTDIAVPGAPLAVTGLARLWASTGAANYAPWGLNVVISNVPGPRTPMYCAGAEATHYYPLSIPFHGGALNITVQSYLDALDFGLIACRRTVPDAQRLADYILDDFAAMRDASAKLDAPGGVPVIEIGRPRKLLTDERAEAPKRRRKRPETAD